jgi:hypothetical protein
MTKAADYSAIERLQHGSTIEIRALLPYDREDMRAEVGGDRLRQEQNRQKLFKYTLWIAIDAAQ